MGNVIDEPSIWWWPTLWRWRIQVSERSAVRPERCHAAGPRADRSERPASIIAAELDKGRSGDANKSSQIRRFYDEIIRYQNAGEAAFAANLPFVRMVCAHAAYAKTRKLVDANFVAFLQDGLRKVETYNDLKMFRTLFEAVIGFLPKKN
jgi:CRISPR-associated protein Csm2